jgi:hypothetical protein
MPSPASTTANIQTALRQAVDSAQPGVTKFYPTIIKEWPINGTIRSLWITGSAQGATGSGGSGGSQVYLDCSLTASATAVSARILTLLRTPFG